MAFYNLGETCMERNQYSDVEGKLMFASSCLLVLCYRSNPQCVSQSAKAISYAAVSKERYAVLDQTFVHFLFASHSLSFNQAFRKFAEVNL